MQIYKIVILSLVVLFCSSSIDTTGEGNISETGFYSSPDEIIRKLDNENTGFKEHFLLGVAYKKKREMKKAILHFANSCFKYSKNSDLKLYPYTVYKYVNGFHVKSDYYDDAVYEIASLFYEFREFEYVIKFVDLMGKLKSALYRDAAILRSNAMLGLEKYDEVIASMNDLAEDYDDINSKSLIHIRIASAHERKGDFANAIKEYINILRLSVKTWQSGIACDRIMSLISEYKYEFSNDEELLLAVSFYNNAKYDKSIDIFKKLFNEELTASLKDYVLRYSVKNYVRMNKLNEADRLLGNLKSDVTVYNKLLKTEADELWAVRKRQLAYNIYKRLYENSGEDILKDSHKRMIQYLIDIKNSGFETLVNEYKNKYPGDKAAEYFLWAAAKNKLKVNDNNSVIKILEEALSLFPQGAYSGRNRYWLIKLYGRYGEEKADESLKRIKEMAAYNPDSAYTWMLLETIKERYQADELSAKFRQAVSAENFEDAMFCHILLFMLEKDFARRNSRIRLMNSFDIVGKYRIITDAYNKPVFESKYGANLIEIEKYFIIGYIDGINRETGLIRGKKEFMADKYKMLAYFGTKYKHYYLGTSSILELLKNFNLKENIAVLPEGIITGLFPTAFPGKVEQVCEEQNIQREMAYAVMKAESTFNHKAVSGAGAVGLMQLMPPTAKDMARRMKIKDFDLKDPSISITFGVKYLAWLSKMFKGDFTAMMAGYNAGAGNVKGWMKQFNGDNDFLTEFIPFDETRFYILRTGKFFIQYKLLFEADVFSR